MTADRAQVDPELDDILNRIKTLSITQKSGSRRLDWLAQLDQNLEQWHEEEGMSITKFKQVVKDMAICLSDLTQYPSQTALKHALRKDPSKIVRLAQAKQFKEIMATREHAFAHKVEELGTRQEAIVLLSQCV